MCEVNSPLVTVIIPTFEQTNYFDRALKSIMSQTYQNIEIVVIDDNTDDRISLYIKDVISQHQDIDIVYVKNKNNLGSARSRNVGISYSKGEYITFLDDDDYYLKSKIEKQLIKMIDTNAEYSVTNLVLVDDTKKKDYRRRNFLKKTESLEVKHLKYHITGTSTFMIKKELLKRIGGFGTKDIGDEFFLMHKCIQETDRFVHCDEVLVFAYVNRKEGLSNYKNKILSANDILNYKIQFKDSLTKQDLLYIYMRHYAVLTLSYFSCKKYIHCITYAILSFMCHPLGFVKIILGKDR